MNGRYLDDYERQLREAAKRLSQRRRIQKLVYLVTTLIFLAVLVWLLVL